MLEVKLKKLKRIKKLNKFNLNNSILIPILIIPILFYFYLILLINLKFNSIKLISKELSNSNSILWLIAHPDDESLFFAPTIINLLENTKTIGHLLSLSSGNHESLGLIRRDELILSCKVLGINENNCIALDHSELPDTPDIWWDSNLILEIVSEYIKEWNIDLIITFDEYGISGHSNHKAISAAMNSRDTSSYPPVFTISSTPLLLKYSSLLSLPYTYYNHLSSSSNSLCISSPTQYLKARESFGMYKSQSRWFRTLFMLFSRYLWFVELVKN